MLWFIYKSLIYLTLSIHLVIKDIILISCFHYKRSIDSWNNWLELSWDKFIIKTKVKVASQRHSIRSSLPTEVKSPAELSKLAKRWALELSLCIQMQIKTPCSLKRPMKPIELDPLHLKSHISVWMWYWMLLRTLALRQCIPVTVSYQKIQFSKSIYKITK